MEVFCTKTTSSNIVDKENLLKEVDFVKVAERYLEENPLYFDNAGIWWAWHKKKLKWEMVDRTDLLNDLYAVFEQAAILNASLQKQFFTALEMRARLNKPENPPTTWIQFKNKIINYETLEEITPTPKYFLTNPLPTPLGDNEETPVIDELFEAWVGPENKKVLYEILAYCLLRDYPIQRIIILFGSGSNGKGQYQNIIRTFLGAENITSSDLYNLSRERFEKAKLMNKLVVFISETNVSILRYTSTIKKLSGGDLVGVEFKGKTPFDIQNYAKLIIASNSIPITFDRTHGFYRRMNIIQFPNRFKDGKDIYKEIPGEEYANLGLKCVKVLKKLLEKGEFSNDGGVEERKERYEKLSNPLLMFIKEKYKKSVNDFVEKNDFKDRFKKYLNENGFRMLSDKEITSALKQLGYETKQKKIDDYPIYVIYGLINKVTSVTPVIDNHSQKNIYEREVQTRVTGVTGITNPNTWSVVGLLKSGVNCNSCGAKSCFNYNSELDAYFCDACKKELESGIKSSGGDS